MRSGLNKLDGVHTNYWRVVVGVLPDILVGRVCLTVRREGLKDVYNKSTLR